MKKLSKEQLSLIACAIKVISEKDNSALKIAEVLSYTLPIFGVQCEGFIDPTKLTNETFK